MTNVPFNFHYFVSQWINNTLTTLNTKTKSTTMITHHEDGMNILFGKKGNVRFLIFFYFSFSFVVCGAIREERKIK